MTDKIVRADSTVVSNIKSCTFKEQVNTEENLRFGACAASSIEFEVFDSQANAIPAGEELTYYQTDDNNVDTLIGVFTAQPSIPSRNTYRVVAYDNIIKLETDFSEHLASIQSSFPMALSALLAEVATVAGVTFGNSPALATTVIQEFSANGVSCRQVVAWAAEMSGQYVHCDTNGDILFGWYAARSGYSVRPGSGSGGGVTYVPYREGGLNYKDYAVSAIDRVAVKPPEEEDVAYIYPVNATGNTYVVNNNLLLTNASSAVMNTVAQTLYGVLSALPAYRPASISLFRFDNPFRAGDIVSVTDVQGVTFNTLVMSMTSALDGASVECTGKETYDADSAGGVKKALVNLASNVVRIKNLIVDEISAVTARITNLYADTTWVSNLFSQNITATGTITGATLVGGTWRSSGTQTAPTPEGTYVTNGETTISGEQVSINATTTLDGAPYSTSQTELYPTPFGTAQIIVSQTVNGVNNFISLSPYGSEFSGDVEIDGALYVGPNGDEVAVRGDNVSVFTNDIGAMRYLGANPITVPADDTRDKWSALGSGYAYYSQAGALNGQPAQYGILVNYVSGTNVTQWFLPFGAYSPHMRASTSGGWYGNGWRKLAEASDVLPAQSSSETITYSAISAVGFGMATSATAVRLFIPMPNNATGASISTTGTWAVASSAGAVSVSGLAVAQVERSGLWVSGTASGLTNGTPVTLRCSSGSSLTISWT